METWDSVGVEANVFLFFRFVLHVLSSDAIVLPILYPIHHTTLVSVALGKEHVLLYNSKYSCPFLFWGETCPFGIGTFRIWTNQKEKKIV